MHKPCEIENMQHKNLLLLNRKDDKFLMHNIEYQIQDNKTDEEDLQNDYELKKAKKELHDLAI